MEFLNDSCQRRRRAIGRVRPGLKSKAAASRQEFQPIPHTSRHGWLAHESSYPASPFQADIDAPLWRVQDGRRMSLREIAGRTAQRFWPALQASE